jgi:hypothetical protein
LFIDKTRARIAAMKPKAVAMQLSAAGTISCSAPQARPPSGKWESIAAKPKGRGLRCSSIRGMSRRSSAITAARFRAAARAVGPVVAQSPFSAMFPWKTMGYSLYVLACRY